MTKDIRKSVIAALDTSAGLMNRPALAATALSGGDFALSELDIDSLTSYEVIMQIEDEYSVELPPAAIMASEKLSDLVAAVERVVAAA